MTAEEVLNGSSTMKQAVTFFSTMKVYMILELFGYIDVNLDMLIWYQNNKLDRMKKYPFRG